MKDEKTKENLKIVHIAPDEKFINFASELFEEAFPNCNSVYVLSDNQQLKYIDKTENIEVVSVEEMTAIAKEQSDLWNIVFFHSLEQKEYPIIQKINKNCIRLWFCFGFEVYNDPSLFPERNLYFDQTYKLYGSNRYIDKIKQNRYFRSIYRLCKPNLYLTAEEQYRLRLKDKMLLIDEIDILANSFVEEANNLKKLLKRPHLDTLEFWYSTVEDADIVNETNEERNTINILIGNSAAPVCNHLDVFSKIDKTTNNTNRYKYTVPLSYGGSQNYISLLKENTKHYGSNIRFIEDFMSLEDYQKLLSTCDIAIIASRRQHAVSNAIILLARGTKLFLSVDNPFYHYLKRIGVHVYSFENDLNETSLTRLSDEQIKNNKETLHRLLNRKTILDNLRKQISSIHTESNKKVQNITTH